MAANGALDRPLCSPGLPFPRLLALLVLEVIEPVAHTTHASLSPANSINGGAGLPIGIQLPPGLGQIQGPARYSPAPDQWLIKNASRAHFELWKAFY